MKHYTLDKMGNHIPQSSKPDKMGNLPRYSEETISKREHVPKNTKPDTRSIHEQLIDAEKLMRC